MNRCQKLYRSTLSKNSISSLKRFNGFRSCLNQKRNFRSSAYLQKIVQFNLADIGEGIAEVEMLEWFIEEGQTVEQFDRLCEVQSDKANTEITSKYDGVVTKIYTPVGEIAKVGEPLVDIDVEDDGVEEESDKPTESSEPTKTAASTTNQSVSSQQTSFTNSTGGILATPAVRRLSREHNIDLSLVPATGKDGRVLKEDMLRFIENPQVSSTPSSSVTSTQGGERREPVRGVLKAMVKSMTAAAKVPHLGYCDELEMDNLMKIRKSIKATVDDVPISFLPFMIKAASLALRDYPVLNARLSDDETELIYRESHNIGFALASKAGLLVPNVKNVQNLSIREIAKELDRIITAGRDGKLPPSDLSGGSLTLSNIGTIGGTYTSPVLLLPEVVICGLGKVQRLPRFDANDNVVARHVMNVSWSADHRIVDGITIASFSNAWKNYLENPEFFLLDMK